MLVYPHTLKSLQAGASNKQTTKFTVAKLQNIFCSNNIVWPDNVGLQAKILASALCSIQHLSVFTKHLVIGLFRVFSAFHFSPSIGKPGMTPLFSVKTTESYKVC